MESRECIALRASHIEGCMLVRIRHSSYDVSFYRRYKQWRSARSLECRSIARDHRCWPAHDDFSIRSHMHQGARAETSQSSCSVGLQIHQYSDAVRVGSPLSHPGCKGLSVNARPGSGGRLHIASRPCNPDGTVQRSGGKQIRHDGMAGVRIGETAHPGPCNFAAGCAWAGCSVCEL